MNAEYQNRIPVTVYSKPSCVQCTATYRALDGRGIPYRVVDMSEDGNALQWVKDMGYQQAPVVFVPFEWESDASHWSGFQPDKLASIR